jgi:polysaccharide biosynthesis protein PslH
MNTEKLNLPKEMDVPRAERPLRIALVYSRLPLPMRRADQMTVAHLISFLKARGHAVDLYAINTGGNAQESDMVWLRHACRSLYLYNHDWISIARGLLQVPFRAIPLQVALFSHPGQRRDLHSKVKQGAYDVVYTYYFRSAEVSRGLGRTAASNESGAPVTFLALQLSQALNTRRIATNAPNFLIRMLYHLESRLVAPYEARIWREFTHTVLIGKRDVEEIREICRSQRQPVIDNYVFGAHGTDVTRFAPRTDVREEPNHLVFSGYMRVPTNIQAVQWFARNVWPLVKAAVPQATWSIVGREPSPEVLKLAELPGVEVTGAVPDVSVHIAKAAVCINPMQAGAGMQNKLIEYLAGAKPVVATRVANEGIGATPGEHLLQTDDPTEFADAIVNLLRDQELRTKLGHAARQFVLQHWTWEAHFMELEKNFYQALRPHNAAESPTNAASRVDPPVDTQIVIGEND